MRTSSKQETQLLAIEFAQILGLFWDVAGL
jgi:hypothetical protein